MEPIPSEWSARFPETSWGDGLYESFYLKAAHPSEARAVWIRYTVHKPPNKEPTGSTWLTYFDASSSPFARKTTHPSPEAGAGRYITIADSSLSPGRARGGAGDASWDLAFTSGGAALRHLPRPWMYSTPVPRTKLVSPAPEATFSGTLHVNGTAVDLDGWAGMLGHNWGTEHAERWIWLHAIFSPGTWIDLAFGRIRLGRWTTPWVANGALSLEGRRRRLGGLGAVRRTHVVDSVGHCDFELPGDVTGRIERALEQTVVWPYQDPSGSSHHSLNCSIASLELDVGARRIAAAHGAVYELGVRETDHGLPVLPYADGS